MLYIWLTKNLYRFFVSAWINKGFYTLELLSSLFDEYSKILNEVFLDLFAQLQAKLNDVRQELSRFF